MRVVHMPIDASTCTPTFFLAGVPAFFTLLLTECDIISCQTMGTFRFGLWQIMLVRPHVSFHHAQPALSLLQRTLSGPLRNSPHVLPGI
mmetsp:Transcript_20132/g.35974  ORF Transcript_20132/g.35974 Transcript_20132/m.35974 type:complete len:89 (+) Transcript_20132:440-706(+)